MLTWKKAQDTVPWNIILLLGGGFAMAKGCEVRAAGRLQPGEVSAGPGAAAGARAEAADYTGAVGTTDSPSAT